MTDTDKTILRGVAAQLHLIDSVCTRPITNAERAKAAIADNTFNVDEKVTDDKTFRRLVSDVFPTHLEALGLLEEQGDYRGTVEREDRFERR